MGDQPRTSGPATAVQPTSTAHAASASQRARGRVGFWRWGCSALLLALAFVVLGIAPMSLAQRIFGPDPQAGLLSLPLPFPPAGSPTPNHSLADPALPSPAWAAHTVVVYRSASMAAPLATLDPGFPVTITDAALVGGVRWDHITWSGPTRDSGGAGWVPHRALAPVGTDDTATADPGALSQALASALAPLGQRAGIFVYYPDAQRVYASNADTAFPLGDGARGILEAALLVSPLAAHSTLAGEPIQRVEHDVAAGDPSALSLTYAQLGFSTQMTTVLANMSIGGITLDPLTWNAALATPRGLAQFYAALDGVTPASGGLDASVRTQVLAALAPDAQTSALAGLGAPLPQGASVLLVTGSVQASDGWSANAAGVIVTPSGVRYVIAVSVRGQLSSEAARAAIATLLGQLAAIATA